MSSPTQPPPSSDPPVRKWTRAWTPPQGSTEVTAVPLRPNDRQLTWDQYLARLRDRVAWMVEEHGHSESLKLVEAKWFDQAGKVWHWANPDGPLAPQIVENQDVQELLLQLHDLNQVAFPLPVQPQAQAMSALKETTLEGWLDLLLPSHDLL